jgi:RNA polymerase sigma-70 factor (ECF subfamily)
MSQAPRAPRAPRAPSAPLRIVPREARTAEAHAEDVHLAEALIAGEAWAATATWNKHSPMVFRFLHRALGPRGEVEDLTQEVFLRVFANARKLREPAALRSFVFSVAIRTLKWELRRRRVRRILQISELYDVPEPWVSAVDAESRQALRRFYAILDRLSVEERTAFALRHLEGEKLEDIAAALGVSLATVKRRLERASGIVSRAVARDPALAAYAQTARPDGQFSQPGDGDA